MENKTNINFTSFTLDILIKGSLFIWFYRALGITEFVSFQSLFLLLAIDLGVFLIVLIIAAIISFCILKKVVKKENTLIERIKRI